MTIAREIIDTLILEESRIEKTSLNEGVGFYSHPKDSDPVLLSYLSFKGYMQRYAPETYKRYFPMIKTGWIQMKNPHYGSSGVANAGNVDREVADAIVKELSTSLRKLEQNPSVERTPDDWGGPTTIRVIKRLISKLKSKDAFQA